MDHPTLEYIRGLRKQLETKKAEIVGQDPATIPGSENDKPIPAGATSPDKETKDQTMVPNSGLSTAGAGDDSPITHKNDLTAEQPALTPKKEPEVTGNAEAAVPGGKTAEEKTAETLGAEILAGVDGWFKAKKEAEAAEAAKAAEAKHEAGKEGETQKAAADTQGPSAGTGTAEALITDTGKEPDQTKAVKEPNKKPEETADALKPATGEGSSGETAAAAKAAGDETGKEAAEKCCADGKCGKCSKCKAAAEAAKAPEAKKAGALDMELTKDVLAKIAAVMLATEEGTKLAEETLAKAAGAEAAEKTIAFLSEQNRLAKEAQEASSSAPVTTPDAGAAEAPAADAAGGDVSEIADTLDEMVQSGEISEDQADQVVVELVKALGGGSAPATDAGATAATPAETTPAGEGEKKPDAGAAPAEKKDEGAKEEKKEAQEAPATAGDAAIDQTVAVPPENLDAGNLPQGGMDDITPEEVAGAIDQLVQRGEITEQEADQLVQEITGDAGGEGAAAGGDVSPEAVATAIQEAVQSGELKPEDAQAVLSELENVPAVEGGAAAAPAADAGAAAAAPAAAAMTPADEPKTAGAKLLAAINAARAAKKQAAAK